MKNERCFLCWNNVGTIIYREEQQNGSGVIDLEFHDKNAGRPLHFTDHLGFRLACLTNRGGFFASRRTKNQPATLFLKAIESWGSNADWNLNLPIEEDPMLLAMGDTWVSVVTSQNFLRFFSYGGVQIGIISLMGSIVTIAGQNNLLAVVYQDSLTLGPYQNLSCVIYDMRTRLILYRDKVPISRASRLCWLGFSELGTLYSFDSRGMLRALLQSWGYQWMPVLDLQKESSSGRTDLLWTVGVLDDEFLLCVPCKSGETYPSVTSRPLTITLQLRIPLLTRTDHQVSDLEESHLRKRIFMDEHSLIQTSRMSGEFRSAKGSAKEQAELDTILIKLIQIACSQDQTFRVIDIAGLLRLPKSFDIAVKVAAHHRLSNLAERLQQLKEACLFQLAMKEKDRELWECAEVTPQRPVSAELVHDDSIRTKTDLAVEIDYREHVASSYVNSDHASRADSHSLSQQQASLSRFSNTFECKYTRICLGNGSGPANMNFL